MIIGGTVAFLAVVILLVFLFSGVLGGGGGEGTPVVDSPGIQGTEGEMPALPPGLVALSDFIEFETDGDISATVGLPLRNRAEDETGLGLYTYEEGRWRRVAEVNLTGSGQRAEADFSSVPQNLVVLRVVAQAYEVAGSLPHGGVLHPDAKVGIVNPRDYKPQSDGTIGGTATEIEDGAGILLMPTIVGNGEDTASMVNDILADESLREQHIQEITQLANSGKFAGIDLEYSSVDTDLRSEFTQFAQELGRVLRNDGRRLSLTLPPPGPQRQAYDWQALGEAADMIKIMPIADPVDYWETMPDALDQLVEDVDPQKLLLVVSPFSTELRGGDARPLGYLEAMLMASEIKIREPQDPARIETDVGVKMVAVNLAQSEGATSLRWSDDAAALSFSYGAPVKRVVYVENVFSVAFKLELVQAYAMGGVAIADASAGRDVANIWSAVNKLIETGTVALIRPNGDALAPRWEAPTGGNLDATAGPSVIWRADEAGSYTLRVIVSDGDLVFAREIEVDVKAKKEPQEAPTPLVTFPTGEGTPTPTPEATPTPTEAPTPSPTPEATATLMVQVAKKVQGDLDTEASNSGRASPGSTVLYRIIIDNDSPVKVTITSLVDDTYPGIVCEDGDGDVIGRELAKDDGDGDVAAEDGPDAVVCTFEQTAPDVAVSPLTDTITVAVIDKDGNTGDDNDDATITTVP